MAFKDPIAHTGAQTTKGATALSGPLAYLNANFLSRLARFDANRKRAPECRALPEARRHAHLAAVQLDDRL